MLFGLRVIEYVSTRTAAALGRHCRHFISRPRTFVCESLQSCFATRLSRALSTERTVITSTVLKSRAADGWSALWRPPVGGGPGPPRARPQVGAAVSS